MNDNNAVFKSKKCPVCGVTFIVCNEWGYKYRAANRYKYLCSYHCLLDFERQFEAKRSRKNRRYQNVSEKIYAESLVAIRYFFGLRQKDVANWMGVSVSRIAKLEEGMPVSLEFAEKLAESFGCAAEDITSESFDPKKAAGWHCRIVRAD